MLTTMCDKTYPSCPRVRVYAFFLLLEVTASFADHYLIGVILDEDDVVTRAAISETISGNNEHQKQLLHRSQPQQLQIEAHYKLMQSVNSFNFIQSICSLLSEKNTTMALLGGHNMQIISTIKSFTSTFQVPYITTGMAVNRTNQAGGYMFYASPYYARALADLIDEKMWSKVYYVYDTADGIYRYEQLKDALFEIQSRVVVDVTRIDGVVGLNRLLLDVYESSENDNHPSQDNSCNVFLDVSSEITRNIIKNKTAGDLYSNFNFALVGLDVLEVAAEKSTFNLLGFSMVDPRQKVTQEFIKLLTSRNLRDRLLTPEGRITTEAALAVDSLRLFARALHELNKTGELKVMAPRGVTTQDINCLEDNSQPWIHGTNMLTTIRKVELETEHGLTGRFKFDNNGLRTGYTLKLMEKRTIREALYQTGTWQPEEGLVMSNYVRPVIESPNESEVITVRVVTSILGPPFLGVYDDPKLKGNDRFHGYSKDLAELVANVTGFEYRLKVVGDNKYGAPTENGTWNGMIGELIRHQADLAIAPLTITSTREQVVHFSKPFMSLGISIMIKKPDNKRSSVFSFMYPLSYETWMCVIFAYVGVSVVMFLVSRFSPAEWTIEDTTEGSQITNHFTVVNSLWFSLGALLQQGCDFEPRSTGGRSASSLWWFFTLIIVSSYTANLAAFLTMERMQSPIESADDLAKQTEIKYGTVKGGSTESFFRTSTMPLYQRMWSFMKTEKATAFVDSNDIGIARVRKLNGKYAFLVESTINEYTSNTQPCDTVMVGRNLDSKGYGIAVPRGSDIRNNITLAVLKLRESGELFKLKKSYLARRTCLGGKDKEQGGTSSLKMGHIAGAFYILGGGLALALIISFLEFFHKAYKDAKRLNLPMASVLITASHLPLKGRAMEHNTEPGGDDGSYTDDVNGKTVYTYTPGPEFGCVQSGSQGETTHTQV